jgi:hypothetical protein
VAAIDVTRLERSMLAGEPSKVASPNGTTPLPP